MIGRAMISGLAVIAAAAAAGACGAGDGGTDPANDPPRVTASVEVVLDDSSSDSVSGDEMMVESAIAPTTAQSLPESTTTSATLITTTNPTTVAPTTAPTIPQTTAPAPPPTTAVPTTTASTTIATAPAESELTALGLPIPQLGGGTTAYAVPTPDPGSASWGDTHGSYPATDLFVPGEQGCGGSVVAPVSGVLIEVRTENLYDPDVDNPALRGGRSLTIVGDDGVRYYLAHFEEVDAGLVPGERVQTGQPLGIVGDSGRTSACHIHFSISPPCTEREWSVRRGAIWPYPYLDAWRRGEQLSPVDEVAAWLQANPGACATAAADPNAPDA